MLAQGFDAAHQLDIDIGDVVEVVKIRLERGQTNGHLCLRCLRAIVVYEGLYLIDRGPYGFADHDTFWISFCFPGERGNVHAEQFTPKIDEWASAVTADDQTVMKDFVAAIGSVFEVRDSGNKIPSGGMAFRGSDHDGFLGWLFFLGPTVEVGGFDIGFDQGHIRFRVLPYNAN